MMTFSEAFRHLVLDNPMTLEGTRAWRRLVRSGAENGRAIGLVLGIVIAATYVCMLGEIVAEHEDLSLGLFWIELGVLTLAMPLSLYGAISGEREKLTWDALILTRLTPGQIVIGKVVWRLAVAAGIVLLFVPPMLIGHSAGRFPDYSLPQMALLHGILFGWSALLAAFTLWVSARTKRSITTLAVVGVALLVFAVLAPAGLTLFLQAILSPYSSSWNSLLHDPQAPSQWLLMALLRLNPGFVLRALPAGTNAVTELNLAWPEVTMLPVAYLAGAAALLVGTWRALVGLERPAKRL